MKLITACLQLIVASITIGATIISIRNAKKTGEDAKITSVGVKYVKKVKEEIADKQAISDIIKVKEEISSIRRLIQKYAIKSKKLSLSGANFDKDTRQIQDSLSIIKENRNIFNNKENNESDLIYLEIIKLIETMLKLDENEEEVKSIARTMIIKIDDFQASLKEILDKKKFS
ncbi:hypothetical protein [Clostridium botulinum]|uniref:hypothetical protein n=1 Tax=Clostridium botulinum TaxID=1491 RepID=UPI001C9ADC1E|nr:hypothetical protein [Clostridium botulinum]MBY6811668.1 hypothetical protein [Clostridium botulinum]MBY6825343.1 hypothetical protein [Clostridium botulinum]MBY6835465.1 hypothetical protein [Clostridium botulinum]MBY6973876.1 hypothetical protein [Clostridium botulinum]MCS6105323.1 hypothetical protein [Clostridium botulinum]